MIRKFLIAGAASLALSSCVSLLPEAGPGPDIYRLSAVVVPVHEAQGQTLIVLPIVQAPRELKNNRVALVRGDQSIAYAASARWASSTPEMLQVQIADRLRAHGALIVTFPADGVDTPLEVRITLRNFEARYDQGAEAPPLGSVSYRVQLINRKTRSLISEQVFSARQRSGDLTLGSIVAAIDIAAGDVAVQTANWVAEQVATKPGS
jgi:cholesterol transport system auxiliary component